jgi:chromosome partitioning protein
MKSKIICVCNNKGGVGKTTTALNLAAALTREGRTVLLIDLDSQGNLTGGMGINDSQTDVYEVLTNPEHSLPAKVNERMRLIPGSQRTTVLEMDLNTSAESGDVIRRFIERSRPDVLHEYIIFDCPPSLGNITVAALMAATMVIIPTRPDFFSSQGLAQITNVIAKIKKHNPGLKFTGVLITGYDGRKLMHREISNVLEASGNYVFKTRIRDNVALAESPAMAMDIFAYSPKSTGAADYFALCSELLTIK